MGIEIRPGLAVAILFLGLLLLGVTSAFIGYPTATAETDPGVERIELDDGGELWPHTSRAKSFNERTLPINIAVYGNETATERLLRANRLTDGEWRRVESDEQDVASGERLTNTTAAAFDGADGANRYTYVQLPDGESRWLGESYQLQDGTYLGDRIHLRAYRHPGGLNLTLFQAHQEYWDWFQLRHDVYSVTGARETVELEFLDHPAVESLTRKLATDRDPSGAIQWVTLVELAEHSGSIILGMGLAGSIAVFGRRLRDSDQLRMGVRAVGAASSIIAVYGGVRFGAIQAELLFPDVHVKLLAGLFYPLVAVGIPVCAYLATRKLGRVHAFTAATTGLVLAFLLEYTYFGVRTMPLDTLVHKGALVLALGFIAAGASVRERNRTVDHGYVRTGVLLWITAIVVPLLTFIPVV